MWKPQEDFVMCFSDESAEERSEEMLDQMVAELREVANKYDFDISHWGGDKDMRSWFVDLDRKIKAAEQAEIERERRGRPIGFDKDGNWTEEGLY